MANHHHIEYLLWFTHSTHTRTSFCLIRLAKKYYSTLFDDSCILGQYGTRGRRLSAAARTIYWNMVAVCGIQMNALGSGNIIGLVYLEAKGTLKFCCCSLKFYFFSQCLGLNEWMIWKYCFNLYVSVYTELGAQIEPHYFRKRHHWWSDSCRYIQTFRSGCEIWNQSQRFVLYSYIIHICMCITTYRSRSILYIGGTICLAYELIYNTSKTSYK